jgi:hypothetical protein
MGDVEHFALLVLVVGAAITAAVVFNRVSERIRIPAPAIFLVAAAVASDVVPALGELSVTTVQRVVSVALAVILFDGGMHIGWRRFRSAAGPVLWVGLPGPLSPPPLSPLSPMSCSAWTGGRRCCWVPRWPRPIRRWCSRCWDAGRSLGAAGPSWRARLGPTTRSGSRCWPAC